MHISEMFRLVRGTGHILDVLDTLHTGRLALRIHDGAPGAAVVPAQRKARREYANRVSTLGAPT